MFKHRYTECTSVSFFSPALQSCYLVMADTNPAQLLSHSETKMEPCRTCRHPFFLLNQLGNSANSMLVETRFSLLFFCHFFQAILIWSLITFTNPTYGSVSYPTWGTAVGWCMIIFCVIWIPIVAIVKIAKAEGNLIQVSAKEPTVMSSNLNFFGIIRTTCAFFSNTSTI